MNSNGISTILDLGMKLHVPYNNDLELITKICQYSMYIRSLYLPCNLNILGSGRYEGIATNRNWHDYDKEVRQIIDTLKPVGIEVNMLLNSIHVSFTVLNDFLNSTLYKYLKLYCDSGLRWLTIANIQLAMLVRKYLPQFKIDVSVLAFVDSVKKAQYWNELVQPDLFCIDLDKGKDIELIKNIKRSTGVPVKVIALDFCLPDCPYKPFHYIHNALKEDSAFSCWQTKASKPWYFYKGRAIPPYYLRFYQGLVNDIKIVDRNSPTQQIIYNIVHYAEDMDSKHVMLNNAVQVNEKGNKEIGGNLYRLYYDLNCKHPYLKPITEDIFKQTSSCKLNCGVCNFCYEEWKRQWQVNEDYEMLINYLTGCIKDSALLDCYKRLLADIHSQRHNISLISWLQKLNMFVIKPFKQIIYYFIALCYLEAKDTLAQQYISKIVVAELQAHITHLQHILKGKPVIKYLDFDLEDKGSFVYLYNLRRKAHNDTLAKVELVKAYLIMMQEDCVLTLLSDLQLDTALFDKFISLAFKHDCYNVIVNMASKYDLALHPDRHAVMVLFSKYMLSNDLDDTKIFLHLEIHDDKSMFAHAFLNYRLNASVPDKETLKIIFRYAMRMFYQRHYFMSKMALDFYLTFMPNDAEAIKQQVELLQAMCLHNEAMQALNNLNR